MPTLIVFPIAVFLIFEFADIVRENVCTEKQIHQNESNCRDVSGKGDDFNE